MKASPTELSAGSVKIRLTISNTRPMVTTAVPWDATDRVASRFVGPDHPAAQLAFVAVAADKRGALG
jgi:hypothetical protein